MGEVWSILNRSNVSAVEPYRWSDFSDFVMFRSPLGDSRGHLSSGCTHSTESFQLISAQSYVLDITGICVQALRPRSGARQGVAVNDKACSIAGSASEEGSIRETVSMVAPDTENPLTSNEMAVPSRLSMDWAPVAPVR